MSNQSFSSEETKKWSAWIYVALFLLIALVVWGGIRYFFPGKQITDDIAIRPIELPDSSSFNAVNPDTSHPFRTNYICDTILHAKFEKISDGRGGFRKGKMMEANSRECGYVVYPQKGLVVDGYLCDMTTHVKYQKQNDGKGGFERGGFLERNSVDCGYTAPPPPVEKVVINKPKPEVKATTPTVIPDTKKPVAIVPPGKKPLVIIPKKDTTLKVAAKAPCVKGTPIGKPYCGTGANDGKQLQKKCNGKGGFTIEVVDPCAPECDCGNISPREKAVPVIKN